MATIYGGVAGIPKPTAAKRVSDWRAWMAREEEYVRAIQEWALKNGDGSPECGQEIRFSVGDGSARYIVLSMRPVRLIHLDVCDGYRFHYANRLTASDVREEVARRKAMDDLFSKR